MRKLYSSEDRVLMHILHESLTQHAIPCFMKNDEPPLAGALPRVISWPELWVIDDFQYDAADHLLQQELIKRTTATKNWQCAQCHENLEGQFDVCWKCGHSR